MVLHIIFLILSMFSKKLWVWSQWVAQPAFLTSFMFTSGGFNQFWGECFRDWGFWTLPLGHLSLTGTMTNHCNVFLLLNTTFENCVKGLTFVEDHYYLLLCSAVCVKIWFVVHVFAADSINKQTGKDHEQMVHCRILEDVNSSSMTTYSTAIVKFWPYNVPET